MKRSIAAIGCVVVAAAVAWLLLREDVAAPEPGQRTVADETAPGAAPRDRAASRRDRAAPPTEAGSAPDVVPAPDAPPAPPPTTVADPAASRVLTVVGPDGTTPLAGARVTFQCDDVEEGADAPEVTLLTDGEGRVRLPEFDGTASVSAVHGRMKGEDDLSADVRSWTLRVQDPVALAVVVRDAAGEPVGGVPVVLVERLGGMSITVARATTGTEDGIARFDDVFREPVDAWAEEVAIALPLAQRSSAPVDVRDPPAEPVVLVLPPTGRVVCAVLDSSGAPVADGRVVALRGAAGSEIPALRLPGEDVWDEVGAEVHAGRAEFPRVGLGLELEVRTESDDASRATAVRTFAGPRAAGEEVSVVLTEGGARPVVTGRLVDGEGVPQTGVALVAELLDPGAPRDFFDSPVDGGTTDDTGRFRITFDVPPDEVAGRKIRIGRTVRRGRESSSTRPLATLNLPPRLAAGETDVGDVVVAGRRLLVEGVVVDPAGTPLANAAVSAMEPRDHRRSPSEDVDTVTTDAEGRFRLEGPFPGTKVALGVDLAGWFLADEASIAPGATGARVVLRRAGAIAGSVRVPAGMNSFQVRVLVFGDPARNGTGEGRDDGEISDRVGEDGRFAILSLRPGEARVEIRLGWFDTDTILVLEDVKVVAGETTHDPRLRDVDPSKLVREAAVRVLDADGRPVSGAAVHFRLALGHDGTNERALRLWKDVTTGDDGGAKLPFPRGAPPDAALDVVVKREGFRSSALRGVRAEAVATLVRAKPTVVRVRLAPETALPPAPFTLAPDLEWVDPGTGGAGIGGDPRDVYVWRGPTFGGDRVVVLEVADPGRYRVGLMLLATEMGDRSMSTIATVPASVVVTVGESGEPVEVVVGADPEELEREMPSSE